MSHIAFLGLGAMGRRMAARLADAGHDLTVWSRSGVPEDLPALRAKLAPSPREAARDADVVFSMVADDEASRAVWTDPDAGALASLRPAAIAVESSTLGPAWVADLGARVRAAGADFLDAPVVGSRPQADAGALAFLAGGAPEAVDRVRPLLLTMGNVVHHAGPTPAGAMLKLLVNALFVTQVASLAELLALAGRAGLEVGRALEIMGALPVASPAAKAAGAAMLAGRFEPAFPLALAEKDVRYTLALGASFDSELPLSQGSAGVLCRAVEAGLGAENLTAIAKLYGTRG